MSLGDVIRVRANLDTAELFFAINDGPLLLAFSDCQGPLVPCVTLALSSLTLAWLPPASLDSG
jgi:hypothetical protein